MPRRHTPRPATVPCDCGAVIEVGRRGPLPIYCEACTRVRSLLDLVAGLSGSELGTVEAWKAARILGAAAERLRAGHPR